ncbi:phage portal protein [Nocardiopsis sp. NPDC007018]|uniref:phage portal protein n=1 Tax=Nocardiopsis sp. NPDC007018 TaxID=3155721 RepID=UPI0033E0BF62
MSFTLSSGSLDTGTGVRGYTLPSLQLGSERFEAAEIFRRQPQVRTVVGFLARNVAQLGLHAFRRVSDTDRERLTGHPLADILEKPLPGMKLTPYQLKYRIVADLAIYDTCFLLKVRPSRAEPRGLLPVPVPLVSPEGESWIQAPGYRIDVGGQSVRVSPDDMIHIHGYSPDALTMGESPLTALRDVLLEEYEATKHRQGMWTNGARVSGVIERPQPKGSRDWSDEARTRFIREFRDLYSGSGAHAGGVPILEDGMTYKQAGLDPRAAQYIEARKLTREEVASAYFIPPPLVGILDHATFSNIREQHKQLYQDTLGPWLTQIDEALENQLVSEFGEEGLYLEFNLEEKLRGSFEERAAASSTAVGSPWMTVNEIRARNNLPSIEGGDDLVTPLNVTVGGQASPRDSAPDPVDQPDDAPEALGTSSRQVSVKAGAPEISVESAGESLSQFFARMGRSLSSQLGAQVKAIGSKALEEVDWQRWENELVPVLLGVNGPTAERAAKDALRQMGLDPSLYSSEDLSQWLADNATAQAHATTDTSRVHVEEALAKDDPSAALRALFAWWAGDRAVSIGRRQATHVSGQATVVQARKHLTRPQKVWRVTSGDPRDSHSALNGVAVDVDGVFPNGARWPGDSVLPAEEAAQCRCEITITGGEPGGGGS